MKSKEEIINEMCLSYRHDYGLRKEPGDPSWTAGMTEQDAKMLYITMEQIYDKTVVPMLEHYSKLSSANKPNSEKKNAPKQSKRSTRS